MYENPPPFWGEPYATYGPASSYGPATSSWGVQSMGGDGAPSLQLSGSQEREKIRPPRPPARMPRERALALARTLKRWLIAASLVGFGTFSGLVALHQAGQSAQASSTTPTSSSTSSSSSSSSGTQTWSRRHRFFDQQGGNTFDQNQASSNPFSGSGVS
jgi:hypothetical protein